MALEENSRICLHMQLIAILSRIGVNNYANNDVEILYRLYLMYLMYVHNYSAQSVDSSERMIVMLCAYLNSFPYRIFIFLLFICLIRVQRYKNSAKSFCVAAKKWYKHADFKQKEQS